MSMNLTFWRKSAPALRPLTSIVHTPGSNGGVSSLFDSLAQMGLGGMLMPSTKVNWAKDVGDGLSSSVLAAPLNWLMRTFPEAPLLLEERNNQRWEPVEGHPMLDLLDDPNPFYSGETLLMCLALDIAFGNAYVLKIRSRTNAVVQLWWVPRQLMTPRYPIDGSTFVSHYDYRSGGVITKIRPEDVIHIRFGLDPRNPRLGLSQLGSLVREVAIDEHASNFTATILQNLGIVGLIISPEVTPQNAKGKTASKEALEAVKGYIKANFTGDKRGEALALGAPTKVQMLQYNMQGFDVGPIRDVSEERVCAAIGIPAAVVGFGTGLQQTKVGATMKEMRQLAWISGVIPLQRVVANELRRSLLSEFIPDAKRSTHRMRFDSAAVPLLWETPTEKHNRIREDFKAQMIMRSEARLETGRSASAEDEIYVRPTGTTAPIDVPTSGDGNEPQADPAADGEDVSPATSKTQ